MQFAWNARIVLTFSDKKRRIQLKAQVAKGTNITDSARNSMIHLA